MFRKRHLRKVSAFVLAFIILTTEFVGFNNHQAFALDNGLAKTPPMGYNDWNAFGCNVSAKLIKETAKAMVESGMKAAGYKYVNIDDCWMTHQRDANGNLVPDPDKFPKGIKAVADYVHSLGLKIGIYESAGTTTCAGYPGSINHEKQDAKTFAKWGIDYLKYDNCGDHLGQSLKQRYTAMRDALAATGRDIVFSMCEWGVDDPAKWAAPIANLWRTTGDIRDNYGSMVSIFHQNVWLYPYAGPGHWNDPDMLEIGNGGMSLMEYRTEFSLWSEMAAPLLAGTDLRDMSDEIKNIYTNREVIAVDQDPLGKQGRPVQSQNGHWVLTKPLANGDRAVVLFNETDKTTTITTTAKEVGLGTSPAYKLRNLWKHSSTETAGTISANVPAHGVVMYRVKPMNDPDSVAPSTTLGISGLHDWKSGTVTETFTNNGRIAVSDLQLDLNAPEGWNIRAASQTSFGAVAPGKSVTATWKVDPPSPTEPIETDTLTGKATYVWGEDDTAASTSAEEQVTVASPVQSPYKTFTSTESQFGQYQDQFAINGNGTDIWTGVDEYSTIYLDDAEKSGTVAKVKVTSQENTSSWAKAGIMARNDLTGAGKSPGYVILAVTPGNGIALQWDSNGNGYLDKNISTGTPDAPVWLKLVRDGSTFTGYYSIDGTNWTEVGSVNVPSVAATQDIGMFMSSHSSGSLGEVDFSNFNVK